MRLQDLYPKLTSAERERLAAEIGVRPGYLWQIATRWRGKRASLDLIARLAEADARLHVHDMLAEFRNRAPTPDSERAAA